MFSEKLLRKVNRAHTVVDQIIITTCHLFEMIFNYTEMERKIYLKWKFYIKKAIGMF